MWTSCLISSCYRVFLTELSNLLVFSMFLIFVTANFILYCFIVQNRQFCSLFCSLFMFAFEFDNLIELSLVCQLEVTPWLQIFRPYQKCSLVLPLKFSVFIKVIFLLDTNLKIDCLIASDKTYCKLLRYLSIFLR